jgi:hypothetical protein
MNKEMNILLLDTEMMAQTIGIIARGERRFPAGFIGCLAAEATACACREGGMHDKRSD